MTLVDSSVWIDFLRGRSTPQVERLDALLGAESLLLGDLILVEVLQGCPSERDFRDVRQMLSAFEVVALGGEAVAVQSAANYRRLRALGLTVRKTIDTVIATWCIRHDVALLHCDRDFEPFAAHLGLRCVDCGR